MDGVQTQPRERSQPPYQRAPSRTSTRMSNRSQSTNASGQPSNSSPRLSNSHPTHRYHSNRPNSPQPTSRSTSKAAGRNTPRLPGDGSSDTGLQPGISSFLHERLQKERKAQSDKVAHTASRSKTAADMGATVELGQGSPVDAHDSNGSRPWSSGGEPAKQKGMGLREMEQNMSDLHKKNFNLKLEVSQRRDMQVKLEATIEDLEAKRDEMEAMNDRLLQELEKRDAAVGEAVGHIVRLEAEVDRLKEERELDQRIRVEEQAVSPLHSPDHRSPTPKPSAPALARLKSDDKVVNRIPSFLSEQTEDTETLRKVYLSLNGSALTLPRIPDPTPDDEAGRANGLPSPTALSTLSESSFVSVYGREGPGKASSSNNEPSVYNGFDGRPRMAGHGAGVRPPTGRSASASIEGRPTTRGRVHTNSQFNLITDIISQGSPLQQIERLDPQYASKRETPRPQSQGTDAGGFHSGQPGRSPGRRRTKDEKREALRRVTTDGHGGVRLQEHALPPTPDTISTATLRRFKNSNDTLAQRNESSSERSRSRDALATYADNNDNVPDPPSGVPLDAKPPPANMPAKLKDFSGGSYFDFASPSSQRPRTADDTTVSYRRGNDWSSDSDDGLPDALSVESSDIWMQESGRINRDEGRISPDLFGFPTSASRGGWVPDAMFGAGNIQPEGVSLRSDNSAQDMFFMQQETWSADAPPPPPNRRSSLHAPTGSQSAEPTLIEPSPVKNEAQRSPGRRQNLPRRNSDSAPEKPSMQRPGQPQFYQPPPPSANEQKRSHYPPISGQQGAGPRSGLNRLFRRSMSTGPYNGKPEAVVPTGADATPKDDFQSAPAMGVPSWVSRSGVMDDDRSGATPPPILRNPRHARAESWTPDTTAPLTPGAEPVSPVAPPTVVPPGGRVTPAVESPAAGSGTGARRKWLPSFGRSGSLKNRNA